MWLTEVAFITESITMAITSLEKDHIENMQPSFYQMCILNQLHHFNIEQSYTEKYNQRTDILSGLDTLKESERKGSKQRVILIDFYRKRGEG